MYAVIVAGGKGTRLAERSAGLPKALVEVAGKPMIDYQLELLARHGVSGVTLLCGYGASAMREHCGNGSQWGLRLNYVEEDRPVGTAGAVLACLNQLPERFLVLYGDTMLSVDLQRFWSAHQKAGAAATLFLHPNDHPHDSDLVETDVTGQIIAFHAHPHAANCFLPNQVNAALYVLEAAALRDIPLGSTPLDFGRHLFPELLRRGSKLLGYRTTEYIKDAGTPERLDQVARDVRSGAIERSELDHRAPAIFLDRDGTINEEVSYISHPNALKLLPGVAAAVRKLREIGYRIVVITNQAVMARGECSAAELARIHNHMEMQLGEGGAFVDAIYYCPHHPDRGFAGEVLDLKIPCACRKPGIGLIERATRDLNLDLSRSWLVGDTTVDIETARRAGIGSILVGTGHAGRDGRFDATADHAFANFPEAAQFLTQSQVAAL